MDGQDKAPAEIHAAHRAGALTGVLRHLATFLVINALL